jgi:hypothetical protein
MTPGNFIGPYRILAEISRLPSSVTYLVEHPTSGTAAPLFLTTWPDIHLRSLAEQQAFAEVCQQIKRSQATTFPLLESGLDYDTPYILLSEREASQQEVALIDQQLQKSASSAATAEFLGAWQGTPPPPSGAPTAVSAAKEKGRRVPRRVWVGALAALLLISCCTWWIHLSVSASAATLKLVPKTTHVQQTLYVVVFTQANQIGDIQGRALSYTSLAQTRSGKATGKVHHDAAQAKGHVVISNISLNGSSSEEVGDSTLTSQSGVDIVIAGFTARQGATITVPAHADQSGPRGNISAYDINFDIVICAPFDVLCNNPVGHAHAQNPSAFTGGHNAFTQTVVQQADIDELANPLINQLTPSAQEKLNQQVAQQIQPGEQAAMTTPQCRPNVQPNHQVNTAATTLTVKVTVTCYQFIYAQKDFIPGVIHAQQMQTSSKYFAGYRLAGDMIASPPVFSSIDTNQMTVTLQVKANSIWAYQADTADQARMAQQVVGKTQEDAKALLLNSFSNSIQDVKFALEGFGNQLPTDASAIHVETLPAVGLHA